MAEVTVPAATALGTPRTDRPHQMLQGIPWVGAWVAQSAIPSGIFSAGTGRALVRNRPQLAQRLWTTGWSRSPVQVSFSSLHGAHCIVVRENRLFSASRSPFLNGGALVSADAQPSDFLRTASFSETASIVSTLDSFSSIHCSLGFPCRVGTARPPGPEVAQSVRWKGLCRLRRANPTVLT